MTEHPSPHRLEAVLASVGEHLLIEEPESFSATRPLSPRRPHRLLAAAATAAVVVATTLAVAPVRSAVVHWLGIGSTRIELVAGEQADTAGLSSIIDGLDAITVDDAEVALGRSLPDTSGTALGAADEILAMPEGGVILVWSDQATTLWIHITDNSAGAAYAKLLGPGAQVRQLDDLGDDAVLITGDHIFTTPNRQLAADTVLLWTSDGTEYRLESNLAQQAMIDVARSID